MLVTFHVDSIKVIHKELNVVIVVAQDTWVVSVTRKHKV